MTEEQALGELQSLHRAVEAWRERVRLAREESARRRERSRDRIRESEDRILRGPPAR
jgi:hypothetical protein